MSTLLETQYVRKYDIYDSDTGITRDVQRFDDNTSLPTYEADESTYQIADVVVQKERLRNEFDVPPGEGYNTRKRKGEYIPPNAYSAYAHWGNRRTIPLRSGDTSYKYPDLLSLPLTLSHPGGVDGPADYHAKRNYYASLGRLTSAQAAVSIIEMKQTIGMIGNAMLTIVKVIRALKKGRFTDAIDALADHGVSIPKSKRYLLRNRNKNTGLTKAQWFSNAWLELQFGWKPLLADIHDIAHTLSQTMDGQYFPTVSIKGYGSEPLEISESIMTIYGYDLAEGSGTRKVSYSSLYRINSAPFSFLQAFGLTDPLSVAWEVVPFSFVIDWFLPIGEFLESLRSSSNLTHLHTVKGDLRTGNCTVFYKENLAGPVTGCGLEASFSIFRRTVESNPPQYPLRLVSPVEILDAWHLGTSLALIQQFKS